MIDCQYHHWSAWRHIEGRTYERTCMICGETEQKEKS